MTIARCTRRLAAIALVAVATSGCRGPFQQGATDPDLEILPIGGNFTLTGDDGKAFDSRQLRGRTVLLFFGYTTCPEACPTTLAKLVRVYKSLESQSLRGRVQTVFVSIDPERDTPAVLRQYLTYFAIPATGVTGSEAQVKTVADAFGASFERIKSDSAAGYLMNHSTYVYLIDGQGHTRHLFSYQDSSDRIAELTAKVARGDCCR